MSWVTHTVSLVVVLLWAASPVSAQTGATDGEWRTYGGDLGSTRYAPLDQITADNFNDLEMVWRFKTVSLGPRPDFNYQATPLMVDGVLHHRRQSSNSSMCINPSGTRDRINSTLAAERRGSRRGER